MRHQTRGDLVAPEQGRGRRWSLRRSPDGVVGSIAPGPAGNELLGAELPDDDGARPAFVPEVSVTAVHEPAALAGASGEPRRRLRWVGWISGRVFHHRPGSRFT